MDDPLVNACARQILTPPQAGIFRLRRIRRGVAACEHEIPAYAGMVRG